ncbi:MAG: serine/threonine protein kinase [Chitinivibrionales bacterium]|nr:serine/threonine protein kinase [Chitinivibrionales bacterium]
MLPAIFSRPRLVVIGLNYFQCIMTDFTELTPNLFLSALEEALHTRLTALARPLPSYINRVYEVQDEDGTFYIAKFYRPGRWSTAALQDEHSFLFDCSEIDIPVVCPIKLDNGTTLAQLDGITFTVFPKRAGRQFDVETPESWTRVGSMLGRIHNAGARKKANARLRLTPQDTTQLYVEQLCQSSITNRWRQPYRDICRRIVDTVTPFFDQQEFIRIHGDFHVGNIMHRPGEGLMVIDFDDMMNGPAVQDFWLLLPDHYPTSRPQLISLLSGYRQFRDCDESAFKLIEGLRAMRMIYFTAWCGMQRNDFNFQQKFPDWGSDQFWSREVQDLRTQYANIMDALSM